MAIRKHMWVATLGLAGALAIPAAAQFPQVRQVAQHDQDDQNRHARGDDDRGPNNNQYYNSKAYKQGVKDGRKDHDKNRGERADKRHWKNDQDRQAYMAGYNEGYRGNGSYNNNRHDQDDQRHDH
jgi:hypothetical protein